MVMDKDKRNSDEFDIVDFDLNEYDEEFEKDEQRLQLKEEKKIQAAKSRVQRAEEQRKNRNKRTEDDRMMPNRDMLKTILMILVLIVVACLF